MRRFSTAWDRAAWLDSFAAVLSVPGLLRGVCREIPIFPFTPGCRPRIQRPRTRYIPACGSDVKDGYLRTHPLCCRPVSLRRPQSYRMDCRAGNYWHHLRRVTRADSTQYQATDCIFLGQPPGVHRIGHFQLQPAGGRWRRVPDDCHGLSRISSSSPDTWSSDAAPWRSPISGASRHPRAAWPWLL